MEIVLELNAPTAGLSKEKMEYHSTVDEAALKNSIVSESNEYERKLELGRVIKKIVLELNVATAYLSKEKMEALVIFENRGQVKDVKPVEWRPWEDNSEALELFEKHGQDKDVKPVEWRPWQKEVLTLNDFYWQCKSI